jgi:Na+-transporting NADH:ubiquinone oxidoreductase subunit NqrC
MNPGLTLRPIAGNVATETVRTVPVVVDAAVRTELAPAQTVTATADTSAARSHAGQANQANVSRELVVDAAAREVIFRVVDVSSGHVVRQVPDEAILRLRAYTRAVAKGESPSQALARTDFQA